MNTKQVEAITGLSRQNIRYYERMGLLSPGRAKENGYRDYSDEDVEALQMIKMLRMLDLSIEDIHQVVHKEVALEDAVKQQKELLASRQKQLAAAMEMCDRIVKAKETVIRPEEYLKEMEYLQNKEGGFAQFYNDYKRVAEEERQKQFFFQVNRGLHQEREIWQEIVKYAEEEGVTVIKVNHTSGLRVCIDDLEYDVHTAISRNSEEHSIVTTVVGIRSNRESNSPPPIPHHRKRLFQMVYEMGRTLNRQRWKSILTICVCAMVVSFMGVYIGNVSNLKSQFRQLSDVYQITGEIRNRSGKLAEGLIISEKLTNAIKESSYITAYVEEMDLNGSISHNDSITVRGINNRMALKSQVTGKIDWNQGVGADTFFQRTQGNLCVVDELYLKNHNLKVGDKMTLNLSYYTAEQKNRQILVKVPLSQEEFTIVGSGELGEVNILCPLSNVKQWFQENGKEYEASRVSFTLKEPEQLNHFKKEMKQEGFIETGKPKTESYTGCALVMDDVDYINAATELRSSIRFLSGFYPLMFLLMLLMGYIISYLLLQSRRLDLAIMKSLGSGDGIITIQIFLEHMLLAVLGVLLGMVIGNMTHIGNVTLLLKIAVLFLICYGIGTLISLGLIKKIGVMRVLSGKE